MAGPMIPPDILNRKSLFSLLHKIDLELAEQTRCRRCPIAGDRCTMPTIRANLEGVPLIWMRRSRFASACAAVGTVAGVGYCRHRCVFGIAGYTGRRSCCWSAHCVRGGTRERRWSGSKGFAAPGGPPSTVGCATFETFSHRVLTTVACPDT